MPQILKISKIITKTSLKPKNNTEKSDFNLILSDSSSETVIKHICQNQTSAKSNFAKWLKVSDCKLHGLILWNFEKNAKGQELQERLFKRDIFFMIEILERNMKNKVKLLVRLAKIRKHYSSVYVMCQILMSAINVEIPFINWDTLFEFTISKHENEI